MTAYVPQKVMSRPSLSRTALLLSRALLLLVVGRAAPAAAAASPWSDHEVVKARLVAAGPAVDGELRLGLQLELAPGWHAYWRHPGDAGLPPDVELSGDKPLTGVRLLYPPPHRMPQPGDLVALGYERSVVYPLRARAGAAGAPKKVTAAVRYLVCAEECIPFKEKLTVDLPAAGAGGAEEALLTSWERRLPRPLGEVSGLSVSSSWKASRDGGAVVLELRGALAAQAKTAELFLVPPDALSCASPSLEGIAGGVRFRSVCRALETPPSTFDVPWTVTGLNSNTSPLAVEGVARLSSH